jgi:diadenosine tetraphosphate (Ap4A) HIT family hydrolase
MGMFMADDAVAFRQQFVSSLRNMLSPGEAGAFILVLANSLQDDELYNALSKDIALVFDQLRSNINTKTINVTNDDLHVFRAIEQTGIGSLTTWQAVDKDAWQTIFNPMRALRPARASNEVIDSICRPFDADKFNFNKPFLRPEILWEGDYSGAQMRVLFNKFPFAPYHLIIVPDPALQLPQFLTEKYHRLMWDLMARMDNVLPGFGVGYNSLGACASVNQLHFQSFAREEVLPIERPLWVHNDGSASYPMQCHSFASCEESWQKIEDFHNSNQPYNLLYRPGRCYVLPRKMQGSDGVMPRVQGAGWIEECGVFNVADKAELESVSAEELSECLRSLSVPVL